MIRIETSYIGDCLIVVISHTYLFPLSSSTPPKCNKNILIYYGKEKGGIDKHAIKFQ